MKTEIRNLIEDLWTLDEACSLIDPESLDPSKSKEAFVRSMSLLKILTDLMAEGARQLKSFMEVRKNFIDCIAPKGCTEPEIKPESWNNLKLDSESIRKYAKNYKYSFPNKPQ